MKPPLYAPLGAVVTPIPRYFATWSKTTNTEQLLRIRSLAKKSFGETFGTATGVSDLRLQRFWLQNNHAGGQAAAVAGYAGPGLHTWPLGHIPQNTDTKPLLRIRSTTQKSFGDAFGAATGVSDPRLQKIQLRNNNAGGKAAAVAGYAGPGLHTWPSGHILQNTDTKPLLRIRSSATTQNSFGEAFGAATGVSDPRLQKRRRDLSPSSLLSGPIHPDPAKKLLARIHGL